MNEQKIAIVADTGCDVPKYFYSRDDFYVVSFRLIYPDGEYIDGETIQREEVYARMPHDIPSTSLPSGEDITKVFDDIKSKGYEHVLVTNISARLSGTNNLMNLLADQYEGLDIRVVNTKNIGIGSGLLTIDALRCVDAGMDFEALCDRIQNQVSKSTVLFSLDTLEYLHKGGRIGGVAAVFGTILKLNPVISCDNNGVYYVVKKARGRKQSLKAVVESVREFIGDHKEYYMAYCAGQAEEDMAKIKEALKTEAEKAVEVFDNIVLSPSLVVNTGPGLVGVGVYLLP